MEMQQQQYSIHNSSDYIEHNASDYIKREIDVEIDVERLNLINENYHSKCGEIFVSKEKEFLFNCSICNENFITFEHFSTHVLYDQNHENQLAFLQNSENISTTNELSSATTNILTNNPFQNSHNYNTIEEDVETAIHHQEQYDTDVFSDDGDDDNLQVISAPPAGIYDQDLNEHSDVALYCSRILTTTAEEIETENISSGGDDVVNMTEKDQQNILQSNEISTDKTTANSSNSNPFKCNFCHERFITFGILSSHLENCESYQNFAKQNHSAVVDESSSTAAVTIFTCIICNVNFDDNVNLQVHLNKYHTTPVNAKNSAGNKIYECGDCKKLFKRPIYLRRHIRRHILIEEQNRKKQTTSSNNSSKINDNALMKCKFCGIEFTTAQFLLAHERTHLSRKLLECKKCNKKFTTQAHLNFHDKKMHSIVMTTVSKILTKSNEVLKIVAGADGGKVEGGNLKCTQCDKTFAKNTYLKIHQRLHNNPRNHKCKICCKSFMYAVYLKRHSKSCLRNYNTNNFKPIHNAATTTTNMSSNEIVVEKISDKIQKSKNISNSLLNINISENQNDNLASTSSSSSTVQSISKKNQTEKIKQSTTTTTNTTTTTDKIVIDNKNEELNVDSRKKNPVSIFKCSIKQINEKLKNKTITIEDLIQPRNPYKCVLCKPRKNFSNKFNLRTHLRLHTGERPYKCNLCDLSFHRTDALKYHIERHNSLTPTSFSKEQSSLLLDKSLVENPKQKTLHNSEISINKRTNHMNLSPIKRRKFGNLLLKLFKCKFCKKVFKTKLNLQNHLKIHLKSQQNKSTVNLTNNFKCKHCNFKFKSKYSLTVHLRAHLGIKPFECQICNSKFLTQAYLNFHQKHTHKDFKARKSFKCEHCTRTFTKKISMEIHQTNVHRIKRHHNCCICFKKFKNELSLTNHINEIHLVIKKSPIPSSTSSTLATASLSTKDNQEQTKISTVKKSRRSSISSSSKGIESPIPDNKKNELPTASPKRKQPAAGAVVVADVTTVMNAVNDSAAANKNEKLPQANKSQAPKSETTCRYCNKVFSRRDYIKVHERIHLNVRPFPCDLCDKTFPSFVYLRLHKKNKHKVFIKFQPIDYPCKYCSKILKTEYYLNLHYKCSHSEERPYACDLCLFRFEQNDELIFHKNNEHPNPEEYASKLTTATSLQQTKSTTTTGGGKIEHLNLNKTLDNLSISKENDQTNTVVDNVNENTDSKEKSASLTASRNKTENNVRKKKIKRTGKKPSSGIVRPRKRAFKQKISNELSLEESLSNSISKNSTDTLQKTTTTATSKLFVRGKGNKRMFKCKLCPRIYGNKYHLKIHQRIHTNEKPFHCNQCNKDFRCASHLGKHLKDMHSKYKIINSTPIKESLVMVDKDFSLKIDKDIDIIEKSTEKIEIDQKKINDIHLSSSNVDDDEKNKSDEKTFKCKLCPREYSNEYHLKVHHRTHTGEKPFSCNICAKDFRSAAHIGKHNSAHHANLTDLKIIENKAARSGGVLLSNKPSLVETVHGINDDDKTLKDNMNVLAAPEEESFKKLVPQSSKYDQIKCQYCEKYFSTIDEINTHKQIHTSEYPFKCKLCAQLFKTKGLLISHSARKVCSSSSNNMLLLPQMKSTSSSSLERNIINKNRHKIKTNMKKSSSNINNRHHKISQNMNLSNAVNSCIKNKMSVKGASQFYNIKVKTILKYLQKRRTQLLNSSSSKTNETNYDDEIVVPQSQSQDDDNIKILQKSSVTSLESSKFRIEGTKERNLLIKAIRLYRKGKMTKANVAKLCNISLATLCRHQSTVPEDIDDVDDDDDVAVEDEKNYSINEEVDNSADKSVNIVIPSTSNQSNDSGKENSTVSLLSITKIPQISMNKEEISSKIEILNDKKKIKQDSIFDFISTKCSKLDIKNFRDFKNSSTIFVDHKKITTKFEDDTKTKIIPDNNDKKEILMKTDESSGDTKVLEVKRRMVPKELLQSMYDEYQKGNISQKNLCDKNNISLATFHRFTTKLKNNVTTELKPVTVTTTSQATKTISSSSPSSSLSLSLLSTKLDKKLNVDENLKKAILAVQNDGLTHLEAANVYNVSVSTLFLSIKNCEDKN